MTPDSDEARAIRERLLCAAVAIPALRFSSMTTGHTYTTQSDGLSETYTLELQESGIVISVKYLMYIGTYVSQLKVQHTVLLTDASLHCEYSDLATTLDHVFMTIYNTTDLDTIKKDSMALYPGSHARAIAVLPICIRGTTAPFTER